MWENQFQASTSVCWHSIFLHLPLKICSLWFKIFKKNKNYIYISLKIIIILLYAPLCFACPLPLAWFLNTPWGTKCEHKLLGRRDRTRMVEWIMGLSSDFERALERSPGRRLWFSYLPNTFLHVPCGWLVEHHNLQWAMSGNWFHGVGYPNSLNANKAQLFGAISTLSSIT
jgi:hypothetical protein